MPATIKDIKVKLTRLLELQRKYLPYDQYLSYSVRIQQTQDPLELINISKDIVEHGGKVRQKKV